MVDDDDGLLRVVCGVDDYFHVLIPQERLFFDCVLSVGVEVGDSFGKVVCELGMDESLSGFVSQLFDRGSRYVLFCKRYDDVVKF